MSIRTFLISRLYHSTDTIAIFDIPVTADRNRFEKLLTILEARKIGKLNREFQAGHE